jgi:glycosyltransferase involved in cell wall biosynthesis
VTADHTRPLMNADHSSAVPTVSVVVPVKNDATQLRRCLRALAAQTHAPDEVIVVDNGSRDDSARTAREAGARVVRCEVPGIPAAAARGYDAARGELVLRLDADCVPGPEWVATMVRGFARHPEAAALTGGARFGDGPPALRTPLAAAYLGAYAAVGILTLGHRPLFGSNLALRRAAWADVRDRVHRDPRVHDDLDLSFHLGERHPIAHLRSADMEMSMRPFADARAFARRIAAGFRTVARHWPRDFPPRRWRRIRARRARR